MTRKSFPPILAFTAAGLLALAPDVHAHSLGIMTNKTSARPGAKATVYLAWGHALPVDEMVNGTDIEGYQVHTPTGSIVPLKIDERSLQANEVTLDQEGIYQIAVARKASIFTVAKGADGKTQFLRLPKNEVKLEAGSTIDRSMRSQMFAKAIVATGDCDGKTAARLGHDLEIVPMTETGKLKLDEPARFRVLYRGRPLPGAGVYATCVSSSPGGSPTETLEADEDGVVTLTPGEAGAWTLSANHTVAASGDALARYDSESILATLTFGIASDEK